MMIPLPAPNSYATASAKITYRQSVSSNTINKYTSEPSFDDTFFFFFQRNENLPFKMEFAKGEKKKKRRRQLSLHFYVFFFSHSSFLRYLRYKLVLKSWSCRSRRCNCSIVVNMYRDSRIHRVYIFFQRED